MLKKKDDSNENLGYGYIQFEKEEDFNKVLKRQEEQGVIKIANCEYSFNVTKFDEKQKTKKN